MRDLKTSMINAVAYSAAILALSSPIAVYAYAADNNVAEASQETAATNQIIATGAFSGRSDHITKGEVQIIKTEAGYQLVLGKDFYLDKAPDPVVALGNGDKFLLTNKISGLRNKRGEQVYNLPASFTPGQFSQAYIWCERFDVPLGIADLTQS